MRKYWLTLGTILAGVVGVNNALQRAGGQDAGPAIVGRGGGGVTITAPGPAGGPAVTLAAPDGGGATFTYSAPSYVHLSLDPGEAGPNEEMLALIQKDGELESAVQQAVMEYSNPDADSSTRETTRKKLTELLSEQFNARQDRREMEIKQIEERVRKLREALDKRSGAKEKIIERRLNDLLTDAEGLGWGESGGGQPGFTFSGSPYGPQSGFGGYHRGGGGPAIAAPAGREGGAGRPGAGPQPLQSEPSKR